MDFNYLYAHAVKGVGTAINKAVIVVSLRPVYHRYGLVMLFATASSLSATDCSELSSPCIRHSANNLYEESQVCSCSTPMPTVFPGMSPSKLSLQSASRSPRGPGRPPMTVMAENTVSNTWSAVSIFERWMIQHYNGVMRQHKNLEKIPVSQLDKCLTIFWPSIKKHDGTDYRAQSLVQLRTRLERHLRAHGYPQSIVKSKSFQSSQKAFKERTSGPAGFMESPALFYPEHRNSELPVNLATDLSVNISEEMISATLDEALVEKQSVEKLASGNAKDDQDSTVADTPSTNSNINTPGKDSARDSPTDSA